MGRDETSGGEPMTRGGRAFEVSCHDRTSVGLLLPEWKALLDLAPVRNPLCAPESQLVWCRTFLPLGRERILAVRQVSTGVLVGVLPLFVHHLLAGLPWGRSVHVLGAVHEPLVHELPEIVLHPDHARAALAAALAWLYEHERWDWVDLDVRDDQPWPEPRWVSDAGFQPVIVQHGNIASVCLTLPPDGVTAPRPVSRNLRESLRRHRNRTARVGGIWKADAVTPAHGDWAEAVDDLVRLHGDRARIDGHQAHLDVFAGTRQEALLRSVGRLAPTTSPTVHRLRQDDVTVAALLTFEGAGTLWVSVSGVAAWAWELSAVTGLQQQAVELAFAHGRRRVVFSTGVDTAKLRWSTQLLLTHRFALVHPRRSSRALYRLLTLVRTQKQVTREYARFTPGPPVRHPVASGSQDSSVR